MHCRVFTFLCILFSSTNYFRFKITFDSTANGRRVENLCIYTRPLVPQIALCGVVLKLTSNSYAESRRAHHHAILYIYTHTQTHSPFITKRVFALGACARAFARGKWTKIIICDTKPRNIYTARARVRARSSALILKVIHVHNNGSSSSNSNRGCSSRIRRRTAHTVWLRRTCNTHLIHSCSQSDRQAATHSSATTESTEQETHIHIYTLDIYYNTQIPSCPRSYIINSSSSRTGSNSRTSSSINISVLCAEAAHTLNSRSLSANTSTQKPKHPNHPTVQPTVPAQPSQRHTHLHNTLVVRRRRRRRCPTRRSTALSALRARYASASSPFTLLRECVQANVRQRVQFHGLSEPY